MRLASNLFNKNVQGTFLTITRPLTLSRTCKALAAVEVHLLHAFGEHDLVDSAFGRDGKERKRDKTRNEEACAAESQKRIKYNYDLHLYPNSAVPVRLLHDSKFTYCMPSGNTILSTAPAEGKAKEEKG